MYRRCHSDLYAYGIRQASLCGVKCGSKSTVSNAEQAAGDLGCVLWREALVSRRESGCERLGDAEVASTNLGARIRYFSQFLNW
ncbi:hypothetical protein D3C76_715210 [compost metagenome]